MKMVQFLKIDENHEAQRIDNFLIARLKNVPKSHIYKIIRKGEVRVNKKRIKQIYKLQIDDVVRIPPVKIFIDEPPLPSKNLVQLLQKSILFEDDSMLVLDKPAGLAVHGGSGINLGVIEALRQVYPKRYLELAHRIDRDTSGCLMIAKKRSFLRHFQQEIRQKRVMKKYSAVLLGNLNGVIRCQQSLSKITNNSGEWWVQADVNGKKATSIFMPENKLVADLTLAQVEILTGRTHQIRVHADFIGHPVLGDVKYGNKIANEHYKKLGLKRMYLHADYLSFKLANGEDFSVVSPSNFGAKFDGLMDKF